MQSHYSITGGCYTYSLCLHFSKFQWSGPRRRWVISAEKSLYSSPELWQSNGINQWIQYRIKVVKCKYYATYSTVWWELNPWKTLKPCPGSFPVLKNQRVTGPPTAPCPKSATVRFIIRYVRRLRLRRWWVFANATRVRAFIINIIINSVRNTANQASLVSSDILWKRWNFTLFSWFSRGIWS